MTNDIISRQAALDAMELLLKDLQKDTVDVMNFGYNYNHGVADAIATLKHLPSAERRGRWEKTGVSRYAIDMRFTVYEWKCSCCGKRKWDAELPKENYCPNCGAKMMNENEEMSKVTEMEMAYEEYLND